EAGPEGWAPSWFFFHPDLDAILREGVARFPNVDVHLEHVAEAIEQGEDHAVVVARDLGTGEVRRIATRYVLGCDGAGSTCRKQAGIGFESLGFDQDWLVVDVALQSDVDLPRIPRQVCDPARIVTMVPNVRRLRRWEFQLRPGEHPAEMEQPARVWELLAPWLKPDDAELIRAVVYTFHGTVAPRWRDRHLFLLGDAAHQMPPFLGQGMCSGIRDAANLSWKLGLVLDGKAPAALLDSYEAERRPHAQDTVEWGVACGRLIDAFAAHEGGTGPEPSEEDKRSAYGGNRALRTLAGGVLQKNPPPGAPIGTNFPQTRRPGLRLDDCVGERFAVFARTQPDAALSARSRAFLDAVDARRFAIADVDDALGSLALHFADYHAVVVRPDRYVFGVARTPEDLEPLVLELQHVLGGRSA
ncbi:MAG: bifunctional 3-(3-hydroxy-phenyl)propionate/3-hydroxycinnamic acid hydroxylase, partial [Myxococcota bacterium]|nr:bifunctional 3-(3-hydroxy-phenyl)propionate/3-hydroxycinnamic acid hydroxylase [Myxococcota bacterium]